MVELCHLLGCTTQESEEMLQVSLATAERDLKFARGWMYHRLRPGFGPDEAPTAWLIQVTGSGGKRSFTRRSTFQQMPARHSFTIAAAAMPRWNARFGEHWPVMWRRIGSARCAPPDRSKARASVLSKSSAKSAKAGWAQFTWPGGCVYVRPGCRMPLPHRRRQDFRL
jgi:hypothetical protein